MHYVQTQIKNEQQHIYKLTLNRSSVNVFIYFIFASNPQNTAA